MHTGNHLPTLMIFVHSLSLRLKNLRVAFDFLPSFLMALIARPIVSKLSRVRIRLFWTGCTNPHRAFLGLASGSSCITPFPALNRKRQRKVLHLKPPAWADRFGVSGNSRHLPIEGFAIDDPSLTLFYWEMQDRLPFEV